jgi:TRAP-type C4-dicarboxylate transport system permease small subunit
MISRLSAALTRVSPICEHVETWVLVFLTTLLVGFSLLQIVLRNFFMTGIVWGDELLRHGVLWSSFLGAVRATAENRHISIDVVPRLMPKRGRYVAELICSLFSCLVCVVLLWASWHFVQTERLANDIAFADIPFWWLELIFPVSFALMALRFGFRLLDRLVRGPDGAKP